jgi:integrase
VPRKHTRVRVEPGLYKEGKVYWACATPRGERAVHWLKLGPVGVLEARRLRDEFAYRVKEGRAAPVRKGARVKQLAEEWFDHIDELVACGELRERTADSYKGAVRLHVVPCFGSRLVSSLGPDDLVRWHELQRRSGAATWSIRARWVAFRSFLGYAARTGHSASNPADLLLRRERPKLGRPKDRFLTASEIERLLSHARGVATLAAPILLFTGLRVSELLGSVWEDVDLERSVIRVRHQMTRRESRRVP